MIPINFDGKIALVSGVGDNESFAWFISKALQAAGAKIVLACHPRMVGIVESILTRPQDAESRQLPYGAGELKVAKVCAMDASYDTMADVPEAIRSDRRYAKYPEYSIQGTMDAVGKEFGGIDILIHSIAFSPEITKSAKETSRGAYMTALGISAYSLTSLSRAAEPYIANRPDGAHPPGPHCLGGHPGGPSARQP